MKKGDEEFPKIEIRPGGCLVFILAMWLVFGGGCVIVNEVIKKSAGI